MDTSENLFFIPKINRDASQIRYEVSCGRTIELPLPRCHITTNLDMEANQLKELKLIGKHLFLKCSSAEETDENSVELAFKR
jgi:hypothetical protein